MDVVELRLFVDRKWPSSAPFANSSVDFGSTPCVPTTRSRIKIPFFVVIRSPASKPSLCNFSLVIPVIKWTSTGKSVFVALWGDRVFPQFFGRWSFQKTSPTTKDIIIVVADDLLDPTGANFIVSGCSLTQTSGAEVIRAGVGAIVLMSCICIICIILGDTKFEKFVSRLLGWYKWYKYHFWRLDLVQLGCIEVAAMRRQWVASFSPHQARSPCQRLAKHSPRTQKDQTKVLERMSADHQRHFPTRKKNFYD